MNRSVNSLRSYFLMIPTHFPSCSCWSWNGRSSFLLIMKRTIIIPADHETDDHQYVTKPVRFSHVLPSWIWFLWRYFHAFTQNLDITRNALVLLPRCSSKLRRNVMFTISSVHHVLSQVISMMWNEIVNLSVLCRRDVAWMIWRSSENNENNWFRKSDPAKEINFSIRVGDHSMSGDWCCHIIHKQIYTTLYIYMLPIVHRASFIRQHSARAKTRNLRSIYHAHITGLNTHIVISCIKYAAASCQRHYLPSTTYWSSLQLSEVWSLRTGK